MIELGVTDPAYEAGKFVRHHSERNWRLSGGHGSKMRDWKKAVLTWRDNISLFNGGRVAAASAPNLQQQLDDLEKKYGIRRQAKPY